MIRLLQWLIFGHVHKWVMFHAQNLTEHDGRLTVGTVYHLKCEKCGNVKFRKFQA